MSSQDKSIGRDVFIKGDFDFEKFEKAVGILGGNFQTSLLVDVGANIGTISIPAVKRNIFEKAVAIEPEPLNFGILVSNININRLADRITAHNLALGCHDSEDVVFELSDTNYGDHRIKISRDSGSYNEALRKTIEVKSETFDKVVGDVDPMNTLIWMDTQGFEGYILAGATKVLKKQPPLVIEFWPYGMVRSGSYPHLKQAILSAAYTVFYDLESGGSPTQISAASLDELFHKLNDKGAYTDLLIR